jgi:3-hydroxyacyl-CoA dehydrogenase/enoyl-CoA hydratase/3-hydroxybutyryl-CoA epimerase/enoyl-CoA isomerase
MCLVCDYRVAPHPPKSVLPEVKLGIFPGFGGTVRLPRVIGVDNAVEWIAAGAEKRPDAALKDGAIDAVVAPAQLTEAAVALVKQCIDGKIDWQAKRAEKLNPVKLNMLEQMMAFQTATAMVVGKAGPNYPAPKLLLQAMQGSTPVWTVTMRLKVEAKNFAKAAVTPQANALVGLFMADQAVKKASKKHESKGSTKKLNKPRYWVPASWVAVSLTKPPAKAHRSS